MRIIVALCFTLLVSGCTSILLKESDGLCDPQKKEGSTVATETVQRAWFTKVPKTEIQIPDMNVAALNQRATTLRIALERAMKKEFTPDVKMREKAQSIAQSISKHGYAPCLEGALTQQNADAAKAIGPLLTLAYKTIGRNGDPNNQEVARISTDVPEQVRASLMPALGGDGFTTFKCGQFLSKGAPGNTSVEALDVNVLLDGLTTTMDSLEECSDSVCRASRFLEAYFRAYFRNGRVFQASLASADIADTVGDALGAKLKDEGKFTDAQIKAIKDKLKQTFGDAVGGYCTNKDGGSGTCILTRPLGSTAFVSRYGQGVQFAGYTLTLGSNGDSYAKVMHPTMDEYGPQIARVFWEAIFDSIEPFVPADATSTVCSMKGVKYDCLSDKSSKSDKEKIANLDQFASQAEGFSTSATAALIRGINIAALNNEGIAKSVETTAGVIARKATEKTLWQRYGNYECPAPAGGKTMKPNSITVSN